MKKFKKILFLFIVAIIFIGINVKSYAYDFAFRWHETNESGWDTKVGKVFCVDHGQHLTGQADMYFSASGSEVKLTKAMAYAMYASRNDNHTKQLIIWNSRSLQPGLLTENSKAKALTSTASKIIKEAKKYGKTESASGKVNIKTGDKENENRLGVQYFYEKDDVFKKQSNERKL